MTEHERRLRWRERKRRQRRRWGGDTAAKGREKMLRLEAERVERERLAADAVEQERLAVERERKRWEASPTYALWKEQQEALAVLSRGPGS